MKRYAVLCGCAPEDSVQKKINEMHGFLVSGEGGEWKESEIMIFPNGVDEKTLVFVLEKLKTQKIEQILLYICTQSGTPDSEKTFWLGGEEISKTVLANALGNAPVQVIYDAGREVTGEGE